LCPHSAKSQLKTQHPTHKTTSEAETEKLAPKCQASHKRSATDTNGAFLHSLDQKQKSNFDDLTGIF